MPSRFVARKLKTIDLMLDLNNPRFVAFNAVDQETIINYLLQNEGVVDLARSINAYEGLMPGEFPIVCVEDGSNIVIEGNRRVCSCKLLLNPTLAPAGFRASIPTISKTTRDAIRRIGVHVINSREEAQIVLGTRHIQGIKKWPSVAKFTFFAHHFDIGKTVNEISALTGVTPGVIKMSLKKHYFLQYILSLDCWTELEKQNRVNYTELHKKGVDRILRIFNTEGSSDLKLTYDASYNPISELPDFGKIVEHIVRRVLNILPGKSEITTRNKFNDIRDDVAEWLPEPQSEATGAAQGDQEPSAETDNDRGAEGAPGEQGRPRYRRVPALYFENLVHELDQNNRVDQALFVICEEIIRISRGGGYRQHPLATSYLTRALIDQTLKRHLRINDHTAYQRLYPHNGDSSLAKTLRYYCNTPNLIPDRRIQRLFGSIFPNGKGIKDMMDLIVHEPDLTIPTGTVLQGWVSQGLKTVLEYLLQ